jgi:hypothetical protein
MSNYINERAKYIQQLTLRHQAYFDICRQELRTDLSVLKDLICDLDYIIGNLVYDEDFFSPQQLAHLEALREAYVQRLTHAEQELTRIDPPQWNESTETLQSSSSGEESN